MRAPRVARFSGTDAECGALAMRYVWILIALTPSACGGEIADPRLLSGSLDDAGAFRAPDGRVLFSPGGACRGYDSSRWSKAPTCTKELCSAWTQSLSAPEIVFIGDYGFSSPFQCAGSPAPGHCVAGRILAAACDRSAGEKADAFCSAWAGSLVTGNGHAIVRCLDTCMLPLDGGGEQYDDAVFDANECPAPHTLVGRCFLLPLPQHLEARNSTATTNPCEPEVCDGNKPICVQRGGARHCEYPCQPQ